MGVRLNRTVLNPRWWITLPLVALLCFIAGLELIADEVIKPIAEMAGEAVFAIETWVRKGADK